MRGGVECGFVSTTPLRHIAVQYSGEQAPIVIEIRSGMTDRGADISWVSQFPHEVRRYRYLILQS